MYMCVLFSTLVCFVLLCVLCLCCWMCLLGSNEDIVRFRCGVKISHIFVKIFQYLCVSPLMAN